MTCVDLYKGWFVGNKREGFGRHVWPDGAEYEGEWKNDLPNGKGKEKWPDGSTYDGECWGGVKHEGVQLIDACVDLYKGSFVANEKIGFGRYFGPDGAEHEEKFKANGKRIIP